QRSGGADCRRRPLSPFRLTAFSDHCSSRNELQLRLGHHKLATPPQNDAVRIWSPRKDQVDDLSARSGSGPRLLSTFHTRVCITQQLRHLIFLRFVGLSNKSDKSRLSNRKWNCTYS